MLPHGHHRFQQLSTHGPTCFMCTPTHTILSALPTPRIFKSKFWIPCHFICIVNISECTSIRENSLKYLELSYQKPNSLHCYILLYNSLILILWSVFTFPGLLYTHTHTHSLLVWIESQIKWKKQIIDLVIGWCLI